MASCSTNDSSDDGENIWGNCPLCLETFKNPKLLPCAHTFCEGCLKDLVRHNSSSNAFDCPSCRERIRVPQGGVSAFKTNFYIDPALLKKEDGKMYCKTDHNKPREIELYCFQCHACICLECKLNVHLHHATEEIQKTAETIKARLQKDATGLNGLVADLTTHMDTFRAEQQTVQDKKMAIEKEIRHRHKLMVDLANKCRDEALFSLDTVTASIDSRLCYVISDQQKHLDELVKLQKRMEMCVKGEKGAGLLLTAQDIYRDGAGREKAARTLMTKKSDTASRPVLIFSASADQTLRTQQNFLGPVDQIDMAIGAPEVTIKEMFRCERLNASDEVFSLFPRADHTVWIAYEPSSLSDWSGRCPQLFDLNGNVLDSETSVRGRTNFTHTKWGTGMCIEQRQGYFCTYAKSRSLLKLKNNLRGDACVISILVKSENPLKTYKFAQYEIKCGPHRAFDVDDKEVVFAVVEEAQPPDTQRKVHLYRHPTGTPLATYVPPTRSFQPSDVCFHKLAGRSVLLVADEVNDAIHVVGVRDGRLQFLRYLAPGCPLLMQPTALNTDIMGRLWVACRGGSILCIEPTGG